jgi:hypothetical protein
MRLPAGVIGVALSCCIAHRTELRSWGGCPGRTSFHRNRYGSVGCPLGEPHPTCISSGLEALMRSMQVFQRGYVLYAAGLDVLLAVRAGRLFDGERSFGPGTVLIRGGRILDIDTTGATPPAHREVIVSRVSPACRSARPWPASPRWGDIRAVSGPARAPPRCRRRCPSGLLLWSCSAESWRRARFRRVGRVG